MSATLLTGAAALAVGATLAGAEALANARYRRRVPLRIHVGGARGKSTVTRLIAAGLRAGGRVTVAKTTGTLPRLIGPTGAETPWPRRGAVRVSEQQRLLRIAADLGADVLVAENMAVGREYLWAGQHRLLRAQIGVITNLRQDHVGAWGATEAEVAAALSVGLPHRGTLVVPVEAAHPVLLAQAERLGTRVVHVDPTASADAETEGGPGAFSQNLAVARAVCVLVGVEPDVAMEAMRACPPDPGTSRAWALADPGATVLVFLLLFSANDPDSTRLARDRMLPALGLGTAADPETTVLLLNLRSDRFDRTMQWITALAGDAAWPRQLALWGDVDRPLRRLVRRRLPDFEVALAPPEANALPAFVSRRFPGTRLVVGAGNIAGPPWGLLEYLASGARRLDR